MLTRQRQLLQQQQATKRTASTQLPPAGGSSAGRPKAVAQRTAAAVRQKVQQDVTVTRALADNMRRNQERANRQIPADKSPKVRRVGPGGANPRPQGQLPPGQRGGEIRSRGGALTTRSSGGAISRPGGAMATTNNGGPVRPVRVRDLGNTNARQLPGQRGLPGGTGGADTVRGSGARTGRPGAPRPSLPSSMSGNAVKSAVKGAGGLRAGLVGLVAAPVVDEIGRRAGTALGNTIRQAATPQRPGTTSGRTGRGGTTADRNTSQTNATAGRYVPGSQQVPIAKPKPQDKQPTPSSRSGGSSGSGGNSGGSAPTAPRSSSAPARRSAAPASNAGMKNQDKNFRGNLFEKTFGYKRGEAPDQVKNKPSSFDTKSDVYTPSTKVDGSKLNALKIDQKKVDEYKRRKDRYYS
jgi:hypothetical protein